MSFCPECGTKNEPNTAFCSNCGKNLTTNNLGSPEQTNMSNPNMPPTAMPLSSSNTNFTGMKPPMTTPLKIIYYFLWVSFILSLLVGIGLLLFEWVIGLVVLVLWSGTLYVFIWGIKNYNDTIRIIYGVFGAIGLILAFAPLIASSIELPAELQAAEGDPTSILFGLLTNGFQIYVMFFHSPTLELFKSQSKF